MSRLKRFSGSRKAQEQEAQLNWIFILIVGALILSFFTFIVIKQKAASEAKFAGKVTQQLNTILVGAKVSSGTVQLIDTPDLEIRFSCNDYYIGPASQRLGNRVVFAPEFLVGDKLITWALDWSVPFKVSTFLYMTTPYTKYIIVDDDPEMELFNSLPDKLNKKSATYEEFSATLASENDPNVRFIFVDPVVSSHALPPSFDPNAVSGLNLYTKTERKLEFLGSAAGNLAPLGAPIEYAEDEFRYGAIFSDNPDIYSCLVSRAYERLNVVAQVLKERLQRMRSSYAYSDCESFYNNNADLGEIVTATEGAASGSIDYSTIQDAKKALGDSNTELQLYSCPLIY